MNLMKKWFPFLFKEDEVTNEIIDYTEYQNELFESITPARVIYATMPLSIEELEKIDEKHRVRPYVVVKKDEKYLTAYQTSSSNNYRWLKTSQKYLLKEKSTEIKKDSMVDLSKAYLLERKHLIRSFYTLDEAEIQQLQKRLLMQTENPAFDDVVLNRNLGDVIQFNNQLYYVDEIKEQLSVYPVSETPLANVLSFAFDEKHYYIDVTERKTIQPKEYKVVAFVDNPESISKQIEKLSHSIGIGSLIQYDQRTAYYIYEETVNTYKCFFTDFYDKHTKDGIAIKSGNSTYFPHFDLKEVEKKDYPFITQFEENEIEKVSKAYIKYLNKINEIPDYSTEKEVGQIYDGENNDTFIYLFTYKQKHYGTSFENLDEDDFRLIYKTELTGFMEAEVMETDQLSDLLADLAEENSNEFKNILQDLSKSLN